MLKSRKTCPPENPNCNVVRSDAAVDGRDANSDRPLDGITDGPRDVKMDGSQDGLRDLKFDVGDVVSRDLPSDNLSDGSRDTPADGVRDTRLDRAADRGPEVVLCLPTEVCGNGLDDDCNGQIDCFDRACRSHPSCINRKLEDCDNNLDDDDNGFTDCDDPACFADKACLVPGIEACNNALDDDDDLLIDCDDPDCFSNPICKVQPTNEICGNGKDDNGDALVDCSDPQCKTFPACLQSACLPDVDFGAISSSGASVRRTIVTTGAIATYGTCAPPGGVARVGGFSLAATADVKLDFTQTAGSAHVVALFRAGVGQTCDQNPVDCLHVDDEPTATQTYLALPAGSYWLVIQSFTGTPGSTTVTLSTGAVGKTEVCDNGIDDDGDGAMDCADLDCASVATCSLCVPDVNLGTIVVGGGTKSTKVDTTTTSNRHHPSCAGRLTGNDIVIRFTTKATIGLNLKWQQTGDHFYALLPMPAQGKACDSSSTLDGCTDMFGHSSGTTNWSDFPPGEYLLIFKAREAGMEGTISVSMTAYANRGDELCENGMDDDGDLLVDCDDPDCFGLPVCGVPMCVPDGNLGDIDIDTTISVAIDLTDATQVFKADCGKGDGRGRAYYVNILSPMTLEFGCTQTGDHIFQVSSQLTPLDLCDANIFNCADSSRIGCSFGVPNVQPGPHFILVQGFSSGKEGTVNLSLRGRSQRMLEDCTNQIDDDSDGYTDCDDIKCAGDEVCKKLRCRPETDLGLLPLNGSKSSKAVETTHGKDDQQESPCVSAAGGADTVVEFSLPGKTDLTVEWLQTGDHAFVLYAEENPYLACEANTRIDCRASAGASSGKYTLTGLEPGNYFLVVDADKPGSEGGVILQISGLQSL